MPRVLVVGDVIDDVIVVPHGPIRSDTDTVSDIRSAPGGSAGNTAAWLGDLGLEVEFHGMVGSADVARHSAEFEQYGVTPRLQGHPTLATGAIVILVSVDPAHGESRSMLTSRGANDDIDLEVIAVEGFDALHLTGYSLFSRPDAASVSALIARARAAGLAVSVDPGSAGFLLDYGVERFLTAIDGATILVPNLEEARVLTGLADPARAATALAARFGTVAVTLDRAGAVVAGAMPPVAVPAVAASIVDPTGAGDAFTAGFLAVLLGGGDAVAAAQAGTRLAAVAVSELGARPRV
jgi:sugar/nucleoside kinase (ribokinase family)